MATVALISLNLLVSIVMFSLLLDSIKDEPRPLSRKTYAVAAILATFWVLPAGWILVGYVRGVRDAFRNGRS